MHAMLQWLMSPDSGGLRTKASQELPSLPGGKRLQECARKLAHSVYNGTPRASCQWCQLSTISYQFSGVLFRCKRSQLYG